MGGPVVAACLHHAHHRANHQSQGLLGALLASGARAFGGVLGLGGGIRHRQIPGGDYEQPRHGDKARQPAQDCDAFRTVT